MHDKLSRFSIVTQSPQIQATLSDFLVTQIQGIYLRINVYGFAGISKDSSAKIETYFKV